MSFCRFGAVQYKTNARSWCCLNHAALTVQSVARYQLRCVGLVLNSTETTNDIAALTNADILKRVLDVPVLAGLGENLTELPVDWRLMLESD